MAKCDPPSARSGEEVVLTSSDVRIVVSPGASAATRLAVTEAKYFLGRIFGSEIPVVDAPLPGKANVVLGMNEWSRRAGLDPVKLPRDGFQVRTRGGNVYIAGVDDDCADPESRNFLAHTVKVDGITKPECLWGPQFQRGTMFGVYDFLERFAGVRMYFPGDMGTVIPTAESLAVSADYAKWPYFTVRRNGYEDGPCPPELFEPGDDLDAVKRRAFYRWRMETEYIPCCHGQYWSHLSRRFAKTHPEYFIMKEDGTRNTFDDEQAPYWPKGHLCHTSRVYDEIFLDAKSYLTGEGPEVRGIPADLGKNGYAWGKFASGGKYFDIMPHDGLGGCHCADCQSRYDRSQKDFATDLVWSNVVSVARRLKADGVPGYVTCMAYYPYSTVPRYEIPDNVLVMMSFCGPWTERVPGMVGEDTRLLDAWTKKLGRKVWLWTYPGKYFRTRLRDVPQVCPRAWGTFFKRNADRIFGAFNNSSCDWWIYNYFGYYVFSRIAWDPTVDVDRIVDEHHEKLFGPAAPEMKAFFDALEEKWMGEVIKTAERRKLGPTIEFASDEEVWTRIYPKEVLDGFAALFDRARAKCVPGSIEARRVAFFRREFLERMQAHARRELWYMYRGGCQSESDFIRARALAPRLKAAGYDSVMMSCGHSYMSSWKPIQRTWYPKIEAAFRDAGLDIVPCMWSIGHGELLGQHPDFAEGWPLEDLDYRVRDGRAEFIPEGRNRAEGLVLADVKGSWRQGTLELRPHRRYRATGKFRTCGVRGAKKFRFTLKRDEGTNRTADFGEINVPCAETQDWTEFTTEFNTAEESRYRIYCGFWRMEGTYEIKDVDIREIAPTTAVRDSGAPVTVRDAADGRIYEMGRDYLDFRGMPSRYARQSPEPIRIVIPTGSRIANGARLKVSFYDAARSDRGQQSVCLTHPELPGVMAAGAREVEAALHPKKWFLGINEFRNGGTCARCRASGKTVAQLLGECVTEQYRIIKRLNPHAEIYIWSDMFDPQLNAHDDYRNCATTLADSWMYIPRDIVICYWDEYPKKAGKTLAFFAEKGFRTSVASFYDHDADGKMAYSRTQARALAATPNAKGMMYSSWNGDDSKIEPFAKAVREELLK